MEVNKAKAAPQITKKGIVMWFFATLFFFYEFFLQVSPGIMVPEIMQNFHVTAEQVGYLATWYFVAYAGMQLPAGALLDRFGPRKLLTFACGLCSFGTLIFATTSNFYLLEFSRFMTGLGSAFAFLGTLVIVAAWFPARRFALFSGLVVMVGMLGAIGGEKPLALLLTAFGWRETLLILFVLGLVLTCVLFMTIREKERQPVTADGHPLRGIAFIFKTPQSLAVGVYGALIYATTITLGTIWGVSFLKVAYHLSNANAAGYISMIFVGWALGSPVFGFISDYIQRRKPTLYFSAGTTFIILSALIYYPHFSEFTLSVLFIAFGFASSAFLPAFSIAKELHTRELSGTALGLMNMFNSLGGALFPPIVGYLLVLSNPKVIKITAYTVKDFHHALSLLPFVLLLAFCMVPFLKETYCRGPEQAGAD